MSTDKRKLLLDDCHSSDEQQGKKQNESKTAGDDECDNRKPAAISSTVAYRFFLLCLMYAKSPRKCLAYIQQQLGVLQYILVTLHTEEEDCGSFYRILFKLPTSRTLAAVRSKCEEYFIQKPGSSNDLKNMKTHGKVFWETGKVPTRAFGCNVNHDRKVCKMANKANMTRWSAYMLECPNWSPEYSNRLEPINEDQIKFQLQFMNQTTTYIFIYTAYPTTKIQVAKNFPYFHKIKCVDPGATLAIMLHKEANCRRGTLDSFPAGAKYIKNKLAAEKIESNHQKMLDINNLEMKSYDVDNEDLPPPRFMEHSKSYVIKKGGGGTRVKNDRDGEPPVLSTMKEAAAIPDHREGFSDDTDTEE